MSWPTTASYTQPTIEPHRVSQKFSRLSKNRLVRLQWNIFKDRAYSEAFVDLLSRVAPRGKSLLNRPKHSAHNGFFCFASSLSCWIFPSVDTHFLHIYVHICNSTSIMNLAILPEQILSSMMSVKIWYWKWILIRGCHPIKNHPITKDT